MDRSVIDRAADLWSRGHTAAEIAAALGLPSKAAMQMMASRNRALFPARGKSFCGTRGRAAERARSEAKGGAVPEDRTAARGKEKREAASRAAPEPPAEAPAKAAVTRPSARLAGLVAVTRPAEPVPSGRLYRHRGKALPGSRPTPFLALGAFQCSWPLVDLDDVTTADMPCCGGRTEGGPYCAGHAAVSAGAGTASERKAGRR